MCFHGSIKPYGVRFQAKVKTLLVLSTQNGDEKSRKKLTQRNVHTSIKKVSKAQLFVSLTLNEVCNILQSKSKKKTGLTFLTLFEG